MHGRELIRNIGGSSPYYSYMQFITKIQDRKPEVLRFDQPSFYSSCIVMYIPVHIILFLFTLYFLMGQNH